MYEATFCIIKLNVTCSFVDIFPDTSLELLMVLQLFLVQNINCRVGLTIRGLSNYQGERELWTVNYTGTQSFIIMLYHPLT